MNFSSLSRKSGRRHRSREVQASKVAIAEKVHVVEYCGFDRETELRIVEESAYRELLETMLSAESAVASGSLQS